MANWRKELRELTRRMPAAGIEIGAMVDAVYQTESDRGCVLIAGSVAENALETIIRTHIVPLSRAKEEELFAGEGVFSSFSAKIKTAFAFGLIDGELRDQFDRLREIRNAFAHSKVAIDFNTPEIRRACVGLLKSKDPAKIEPRALYANAAYLLMHAGTLALQRARSKRKRRPRPILYDEALASFGKWLRQFQRQTQRNLRAESKGTIP